MKIKPPTLISLLMILILFLTACGQPAASQSAAELLSLGEKYLLELDYEQAIVHFTKVIEIEPMNVRAYIGRGDAYVHLNGQLELAIADYKKAIEIDDTSVEVYLRLADCHIALGSDDKAREILRQGYGRIGESEISKRLEELLMTSHHFSYINDEGNTVTVLGQTDLADRLQGFCIMNIFVENTSKLTYLAEGDFVDGMHSGHIKKWWIPDYNMNEMYDVDNGCGRSIGEHLNDEQTGYNEVECYIGYTINKAAEDGMIRFDDISGNELVHVHRGYLINGRSLDDPGEVYSMFADTKDRSVKYEYVGQFKDDKPHGFGTRWENGNVVYTGQWVNGYPVP
jgi:tetratricopeptide (TPR) repeat protein